MIGFSGNPTTTQIIGERFNATSRATVDDSRLVSMWLKHLRENLSLCSGAFDVKREVWAIETADDFNRMVKSK